MKNNFKILFVSLTGTDVVGEGVTSRKWLEQRRGQGRGRGTTSYFVCLYHLLQVDVGVHEEVIRVCHCRGGRTSRS